MKKIIMISILSLMSSVYALDAVKEKVEMKSENVQIQENKPEVKEEVKNETFLYEFDFSAVGKPDKSIHKYMTNNPESVATNKALEDTMKKNWNLNSEYGKNLKFKSEHKVSNQLVCKYSNGLVIKVKAYGEYSTNCPLKN